jgi:hypothetical protein
VVSILWTGGQSLSRVVAFYVVFICIPRVFVGLFVVVVVGLKMCQLMINEK